MLYVIKRDKDGPVMESAGGKAPDADPLRQPVSTGSRTAHIAGGAVPTLAFLFVGIFAFRKVTEKV